MKYIVDPTRPDIGSVFGRMAKKYDEKRMQLRGFSYRNDLIRGMIFAALGVIMTLTVSPVFALSALTGPLYLIGRGLASTRRLNVLVNMFDGIEEKTSLNIAAAYLVEIQDYGRPGSFDKIDGKFEKKGLGDEFANMMADSRNNRIKRAGLAGPTQGVISDISTSPWKS